MVARRRAVEALVTALDNWRGRRVLVTGHTGFKGSWLSLWLAQAGAMGNAGISARWRSSLTRARSPASMRTGSGAAPSLRRKASRSR